MALGRFTLVGLMLVFPHVTHVSARPVPSAAPAQRPDAPPAQAPPPATAPAPAREESNYRETVVVSASKVEQQLVDAPATMTVIGPRDLEVTPANNYADLLRSVPGLNISQLAARDINMTSRSATGSIATAQLAVLDGRSLYQDFFGFVMWDFMPADLDQVKRIEVIRGPASAVWGANALNGVISVITKSPREAPGTTITIGGGVLNREVKDNGAGGGDLFYVRGSHAGIANDRVSYRVTTGTSMSDAFARPIGLIPNDTNTPYPAYTNQGTSQPKVDLRVDYDFPDGQRKLQMSGGYGSTDGVIHSGLGPFDISNGARMGYWQADFTRNALRLQAFMNTLDGDGANLVTVGPDGQPIGLEFHTRTFDVELGHTSVVRARHVLTYGGNLRINRFNLTIAPGETGRTEGGAYLQDEILLHDKYRLVAGARIDKFSSIDHAVFSPRLAFVIKPREQQSVRVSYNRAFRAPSMVNNNLDTVGATPLPLGAISPAFGDAVYLVPTEVKGNPDLVEEYIDAYEVAYTATIGDRATVSAATYYTEFKDAIFFLPTSVWLTPPPGFPGVPTPVPPSVLWQGLLDAGIVFPSSYTYRNLGVVRNKGIELGLDGRVSRTISAFANYAFQAEPVPAFPGMTTEEALAQINLPARHLFNIGLSWLTDRYFGSAAVTHSARAFWQDVLDARYHGFTEPYTMANVTAGVKFQGGRYSAALKITNLGNAEVQQHVFGDVVKRQVVGEIKLHFD